MAQQRYLFCCLMHANSSQRRKKEKRSHFSSSGFRAKVISLETNSAQKMQSPHLRTHGEGPTLWGLTYAILLRRMGGP
jgi:hypothetical protein